MILHINMKKLQQLEKERMPTEFKTPLFLVWKVAWLSQTGGCVTLFSSRCWGCENFIAVKLRAKISKIESRLNNQYIYYVIKNTGCNIARCSALILISLVSLSGTRSCQRLQTKKQQILLLVFALSGTLRDYVGICCIFVSNLP